MVISNARGFCSEEARKLRTAVKDDAVVVQMIDEFEETARRATVLASADNGAKYELANDPVTFLGLMCNTYSLVYSFEGADEIRDPLINSWAAVKITLFAIEQPEKLNIKGNRDATETVVDSLQWVEREWSSQRYEDVMGGFSYNSLTGRDDPLKGQKFDVQIKAAQGTLAVLRNIQKEFGS